MKSILVLTTLLFNVAALADFECKTRLSATGDTFYAAAISQKEACKEASKQCRFFQRRNGHSGSCSIISQGPISSDPASGPIPPQNVDNSCEFAFDGVCDDGRPGSTYSVCELGTDSYDCSADAMANSCEFANDGICDDGRTGSSYSACEFGTDENDCRGI